MATSGKDITTLESLQRSDDEFPLADEDIEEEIIRCAEIIK